MNIELETILFSEWQLMSNSEKLKYGNNNREKQQRAKHNRFDKSLCEEKELSNKYSSKKVYS
jgi:hypothetical protein